MKTGFEYVEPSRPWKKTDWSRFYQILLNTEIYIPSTITQEKLDNLVRRLVLALSMALDEVCTMTPGHHRDPNNQWYSQWMEDLRI